MIHDCATILFKDRRDPVWDGEIPDPQSDQNVPRAPTNFKASDIHGDKQTVRAVIATDGGHFEELKNSGIDSCVIDMTQFEGLQEAVAFRTMTYAMTLSVYVGPIASEAELVANYNGAKIQARHYDGRYDTVLLLFTSATGDVTCLNHEHVPTQFVQFCGNPDGVHLPSASLLELERVADHAFGDPTREAAPASSRTAEDTGRGFSFFLACHCPHFGPGSPDCKCGTPRYLLVMASPNLSERLVGTAPGLTRSDTWVETGDARTTQDVLVDARADSRANLALDPPSESPYIDYQRRELSCAKPEAGDVHRTAPDGGGNQYTKACFEARTQQVPGVATETEYQLETACMRDPLWGTGCRLSDANIVVTTTGESLELRVRWAWPASLLDKLVVRFGGDFEKMEDTPHHSLACLDVPMDAGERTLHGRIFPTGSRDHGHQWRRGLWNKSAYRSGIGASHSVVYWDEGEEEEEAKRKDSVKEKQGTRRKKRKRRTKATVLAASPTNNKQQVHRLLWEGVGFLATTVDDALASTRYVVQRRQPGQAPVIYLVLAKPLAPFGLITRPRTLVNAVWFDAQPAQWSP